MREKTLAQTGQLRALVREAAEKLFETELEFIDEILSLKA